MPTDYGYGINGNGRPLSFEDYQRLLAAGQRWVADAQSKDPEWQAWQQARSSYSAENADQAPASPTKDYWSAWRATLAPEVSADFNRHMADSRSWTDDVGKALKVGIPLMVGGAALAGTGLFGAGAQAAVGGAPLGGTTAAGGTAAGAGSSIGGSGSIVGGGMGGTGSGMGVAGVTNPMTLTGTGTGLALSPGAVPTTGLATTGLGAGAVGGLPVLSSGGLLDSFSLSDVLKTAKKVGGLLGGGGDTGLESYPLTSPSGRGQPVALQTGGAPGASSIRPPNNGLADILRSMQKSNRWRGLLEL